MWNVDIQKININKIKHAQYNPRKDLKPGDAEYEKLKRSISRLGDVWLLGRHRLFCGDSGHSY